MTSQAALKFRRWLIIPEILLFPVWVIFFLLLLICAALETALDWVPFGGALLSWIVVPLQGLCLAVMLAYGALRDERSKHVLTLAGDDILMESAFKRARRVNWRDVVAVFEVFQAPFISYGIELKDEGRLAINAATDWKALVAEAKRRGVFDSSRRDFV